jgi:hypothetical protein
MAVHVQNLQNADKPSWLKRSFSHHTQRRVAFYDPASLTLALDTSRPLTLTLDGPRASDLLGFVASLPERERPRTVYLCGGDSSATTPPVSWWHEPLASGWALRGWHNAADRRTGVYEREGISIDLRMAAPWFGASAAALDPVACLDAWRLLLRQLRGAFGNQLCLLTTPAMTGLEALEASLPYGVQVETLPDELRDFLWGITTQGRRELFAPFTRTVTALSEIDARWMYAACLHHLPTGPVLRDNCHEFAGYTPGVYLVQATVPTAWNHIGLLPDLGTLQSEEQTVYPRRPRQRFWSWASGAEVLLAQQHGWRLRIHQRILWPETEQRPDVAKIWITKLRALREAALHQGMASSDLAAGAYRHLVLDVVGRWYSRDREEHGILPFDRLNELPAGAIPHIERDERSQQDVILWSRWAPLRADLLKYSHPEWSATVWGRARARLAAEALRYPLGALVALRTDAIWTTANAYDLAVNDHDPRPGAWRVKSYLQGPEFWPTNEAQLIELMRQARGGEDE